MLIAYNLTQVFIYLHHQLFEQSFLCCYIVVALHVLPV